MNVSAFKMWNLFKRCEFLIHYKYQFLIFSDGYSIQMNDYPFKMLNSLIYRGMDYKAPVFNSSVMCVLLRWMKIRDEGWPWCRVNLWMCCNVQDLWITKEVEWPLLPAYMDWVTIRGIPGTAKDRMLREFNIIEMTLI